ncbi:hypothetical protein LMG22037_06621 [Paraburkholderia phenoliruptrix]|uniref:Uncharacterized protein n=1 Tax=Paraburkholderia phenoliruptrix TaxID=252970 RepID=A0A6J5CSF9_9BURK|nr:hypothetical protein [Paraburkholderia phenoliruptrix]CAB3742670.1 hypothetical protein LMG22037_06621 [Paraburkholderia phenoliruptrix]
MKRFIGPMMFLTAGTVYAVDLSGIPQNCQAPLAHDMEVANIPNLLELGANAARIISIKTLGGTEAYQYAPGLYRIDCSLIVHWSNGTTDYGYRFSMWQDKYGGLKGSYSPH